MDSKHTDSDLDALLPRHGGYRNLKSFQVARLAYDVTHRFCALYIPRSDRTHDQMVQAARSGVQNIAEGSIVSATSKKLELKLTQVARASLGELQLDYEDYLRQRGLEAWAPSHPALRRFKARRVASMEELRGWLREELERTQTDTDAHGTTHPDDVRSRPGESVLTAQLVANAALSLLNVCCYMLDRQVKALAEAFERDGGFTERLYRHRTQRRKK